MPFVDGLFIYIKTQEEWRRESYFKIGFNHGCSGWIRDKMIDETFSQVVWCNDEHVESKQNEVS